ncbi:alcohol dehydrogenase catalytic domain-containing protein [Pseudomonas corrugata]|uniref:alcohol dehydrogenase catalytic domain-containing protein n=1 Tax=Pseudomonas corrugata TaxID=47879 RepID=UPI001F51CF13|nr:hypothetical protein [Pseudomonas corrugata]
MDFSGIVTAVGSGVTRLKVGDAVLGLARFKDSGAFGQALVTKEAFLAKKKSPTVFPYYAPDPEWVLEIFTGAQAAISTVPLRWITANGRAKNR